MAYGEWLKENGSPDAKLILLTHRTSAPPDFLRPGGEYGIAVTNRHVLRWQAVYDALAALTEDSQPYVILAKEFCQFLYTQGVAMQTLNSGELVALTSFVKTGSANTIQRFMNDLRVQLKSIAQERGLACSWEQGINYQYGGRFEANYGLYNWVHIKDKPMRIAWGFCFEQGQEGEQGDPWGFQRVYNIEADVGVFLNVIYSDAKEFKKAKVRTGDDWYSCKKNTLAHAPEVAFKSLTSFDEDKKDIGVWFRDRFAEACAYIKSQ